MQIANENGGGYGPHLAGVDIEALMKLSTKVDISVEDFRNSTVGGKVRQKLDNLRTLKRSMELGLIRQQQFAAKQKQFLDSFDFKILKSATQPQRRQKEVC